MEEAEESEAVGEAAWPVRSPVRLPGVCDAFCWAVCQGSGPWGLRGAPRPPRRFWAKRTAKTTARRVSPSQKSVHTGAAIPGSPHRPTYQPGMKPSPMVDMPTIVIPMAPARPALKRPERASSR